jgi:hypothetical protein
MQFIERLFGVSPDAGNGLLELCLVAIPIIVLGVRTMLRRATN